MLSALRRAPSWDFNGPIISIPIQRFCTSRIKQQAIRASHTVIPLHICTPPVLEGSLIRHRFRQCGTRIAVSERPPDLSPTNVQLNPNFKKSRYYQGRLPKAPDRQKASAHHALRRTPRRTDPAPASSAPSKSESDT